MRKKLFKILVAMSITGFVATSCKKETTDGISREVKVSYPEITLKGEELVVLPVGANYTDQGAILKDDITGKESDLAPTSDNVDTDVPGLYLVIFSASNANGFETTVARRVAVTSVTNTVNRSGTYVRTATGVSCFVERVSEGVYKVTNPGGAGIGTNIIVYMVETEKGKYTCPAQPTDAGTMSVTEINFTEGGSTWRVLNAGYGNGLRTFVKQ
ncbi:DUF5011 domain-containing protein [Flavihumibacter rivuli]|uniref:immunoglobulin-like domain-containing protein n=1 Tax=Flavihumibacter rivuli TaxID=2838156 RepID=UPI001BDE3446|nr:immunoglobulin-like domain-containing protein [Flavihumibacter rivuli]ULQ56794.1 DUF5011 domain-containing protein [Flavihumibacter rivuli]